ncbi:unnamed protein product, partial [Larinioides sclopetarius]
ELLIQVILLAAIFSRSNCGNDIQISFRNATENEDEYSMKIEESLFMYLFIPGLIFSFFCLSKSLYTCIQFRLLRINGTPRIPGIIV